MKNRIILAGAAALLSLTATAQVGAPFIHDPSAIVESNGKYYTFGTGTGSLVSNDGWVWEAGYQRPRTHSGAAPDAMKIGDRYLLAWSSTGGGLGGAHAGTILTSWNKTLDIDSPDFGWSEPIKVAESLQDEDCDAIDAALLLDPSGRLWVSYGTFFGNIRILELDPKTGDRAPGAEPVDVAIDCEGTGLQWRDGWYYLYGTHGTCCDGVNSTYNIVVGRSRNATGPYLDNLGRDMMEGGGKMVVAAGNRKNGAGHFGLWYESEDIQKMSFHWEADYDFGGSSTLAIRPLLWRDGWPKAGELFEDGTYEIESERRGYAVELAVDFVRLNVARRRGFGGADNEPIVPLECQKLEDVIDTWPTGNIDVRANDYMFRPHQRWTITAVPEAGGYIGGPYVKICIEGTNRALAATAGAELTTVPEFTGADEQLWRIDQLTDGTYRIMPKAVPGTKEQYCLVSTADTSVSLGKFDPKSDNSKWNLRAH